MSNAIKELHKYLAKSPSVVYPEDVLAYLPAIEDENAKLREREGNLLNAVVANRNELLDLLCENKKLRELIQDMWTLLVLTGNDDVLVEIDINGSRKLFSADEISDRMRGLGMEADV